MASKKKGLSIEEKRQRLLELFYETKEFYQLKELERIAPKSKGIVMQSVKEIVQMLVDDGLVQCEKIGTFVCYWAFPSKASQTRKRKYEELTASLDEIRKKKSEITDAIAIAKQGKEISDERRQLVEQMSTMELRKADLIAQLDKYSDCDPSVIEKLKADANVAKAAANRWTDNIFSAKQWCKTKFQLEEKQLNKQFAIPDELDYVD